MSGAPSSRHSRRARPNVPAVRGWVTASGGKGQAVTSMPAVSVHIGGIAVAGDDRVGKLEGPPQQRGVARFVLVEEVADDETAGINRPQLAEPGLVGDALARAQIGDRGRALGSVHATAPGRGTRRRSPSIPTRTGYASVVTRAPSAWQRPTSASTRSMCRPDVELMWQ